MMRSLVSLVAPLMALLVILLVSSACKPTVEGESRAWADHVAASRDYGARWPGFAAVLDGKLAEAEPVMKSADNITDAEARAEAMQAANKVVSPLLDRFARIDRALEQLDRAAAQLGRVKADEAERPIVDRALAKAERARTNVESALKSASPATAAEAERELDAQLSTLDGALDTVEKTHELVSAPDDTKAEQPKTEQPKAAEPPPEP